MARATKRAKRTAKLRKVAKQALAAAAAEPGAAAMAGARTVVLQILEARFGNLNFRDDMKLGVLQLNPTNLAGLAQDVRDAGVPVDYARIQVCKSIIDLIIAVARVIEAMS
jgi:hypothetical protein